MSPLEESDLILNERGAVYHLDIRPEELGDTVIIVRNPETVSEIANHFDSVTKKNPHREFVSQTGMLGKKRVTVVSSGIGPGAVDILINELDALANIDFTTRELKKKLKSLIIIRVGTSTSLQKDIPVGSLVASTHGIGIDNLLNFYRTGNNEEEKQILHAFITHTQLHQQVTQPYIHSASVQVLKNFVNGFLQGITISCPGFYGPQGRVLRMGLTQPDLINHFTSFRFGSYKISNFEMETAAIYGLGSALGHQTVSLHAVTANRLEKKISKDPEKSVNKLIEKTLTGLDQL
jgi:uridine phosphorylase